VPPDVPPALRQQYAAFEDALWEGEYDTAWTRWGGLRNVLPTEIRARSQRQLTLSLMDRSQEILLRYLRGGDVRWSREIFEEGERVSGYVRELIDDDFGFDIREDFFKGRAAVETGNYAEAERTLLGLLSRNPGAVSAYNALGLADWKQN